MANTKRTYYYTITETGSINVSQRRKEGLDETIRAYDLREAKARVRINLEKARQLVKDAAKEAAASVVAEINRRNQEKAQHYLNRFNRGMSGTMGTALASAFGESKLRSMLQRD